MEMKIPSPQDFLRKRQEEKLKNIKLGEEKIKNYVTFKDMLLQNDETTINLGADIIGGKGIGLIKLNSLSKINIPNFFIVSSEYFNIVNKELDLITTAITNKQKLNSNDLEEKDFAVFSETLIPNINSNIIDYLSHIILKKVEDLEFNSSLMIRSSCNLEDSSDKPFAGVFESVLVEKPTLLTIGKAIQKVYSSTFTLKSFLYLQKYNLGFKDLSMALIVQCVPNNVLESGSIFVSENKIIKESGEGLIPENLINHTDDINEDVSLLEIISELRNSTKDDFTIEYVKTQNETFLVQMRNIPKLSQSSNIFSNNDLFKKVFETETKSINFGTAEGKSVYFDKNTDINIFEDIILISSFDKLFNAIKNSSLNLANPHIKGIIIIYDNMFYHLSLLARELLSVPVAFINKDLSNLENKQLGISVETKTTIYEKII